MTQEEFEIQYNAIRNANFFIISTLIAELAKTKGSASQDWLDSMRAATLKELDGARQQSADAELDPKVAQIAEVARSVVGATYDLAKLRSK